jgi:uncharacterized glyoxalase superfamily protein PhnB
MLKKLTPNLMVEDVDRTIAFYRDVLGFELLVTVPPEQGPFGWAMMRRDSVEIMFQSRSSLGEEIPALLDAPIGASVTFYTEVSGLDDLYQQVKGRAEIVQDLHETFYGSREFSFRDLNGYILFFSEGQ